MARDARSGPGARAPADRHVRSAQAAVWRLLPRERVVSRLPTRLPSTGLACLVGGLPGLARLAAAGTVSTIHSGLLAVGYDYLVLAAAVPVTYWTAVVSVGVGTLAARRAPAAWRHVRAVVVADRGQPEAALRP